MNKKEIGNRLKQARKNAGFTQKQVAEKLGMVQPSYIKYEDGRIELDYHKMIYLCKLYKVSSDYILGLEDEYGNKLDYKENYNEYFIYNDGTHYIKYKKN